MQFQRLTMCTNILSIFKFVKILNHSQVQVLSNKKKPAAFCVFCGLIYSFDNLLSFDTTGQILCAQCKYVTLCINKWQKSF